MFKTIQIMDTNFITFGLLAIIATSMLCDDLSFPTATTAAPGIIPQHSKLNQNESLVGKHTLTLRQDTESSEEATEETIPVTEIATTEGDQPPIGGLDVSENEDEDEQGVDLGDDLNEEDYETIEDDYLEGEDDDEFVVVQLYKLANYAEDKPVNKSNDTVSPEATTSATNNEDYVDEDEEEDEHEEDDDDDDSKLIRIRGIKIMRLMG